MFGWFKNSKPDNDLVVYLLTERQYIKAQVEEEIIIVESRQCVDYANSLKEYLDELNNEIKWLRDNIKNQEVKYVPVDKNEEERDGMFILHDELKGFPKEFRPIRSCEFYKYAKENGLNTESKVAKMYIMFYVSSLHCPNVMSHKMWGDSQEEWLLRVEAVELHEKIRGYEPTYRYGIISQSHHEAKIEDIVFHEYNTLNITNKRKLLSAIMNATRYSNENPKNLEVVLYEDEGRWFIDLNGENDSWMITSYKKEAKAQEVFEQCQMIVNKLECRLETKQIRKFI